MFWPVTDDLPNYGSYHVWHILKLEMINSIQRLDAKENNEYFPKETSKIIWAFYGRD